MGGSRGAVYCQCDGNSECYSKHITDKYCELKWVKKLCHNGSCAKRGQDGYDPAYKFSIIYDTIVHNTNFITKYANENQVIDESTWGHGGFGEAGSGLCGRLMNKPKSRGGQVVIVTDVGHCRPRAILHRHKCHNKGSHWTRSGPFEVKCLAQKLLDMTESVGNAKKQIFRKQPCITVDNYFIDEKILHWSGVRQLGLIGTNRRDLLPPDIDSEFLHKNATTKSQKHAKVARYSQPIVAVKNCDDGYQRVHVSFQSTSSCNIATVNALNECKLFYELRERGRGEDKRHWAIEMNDARRLYLSTYNGIDVMDHMINNTDIFYRTWKYWHAPVNHALSMAIVIAFDVYGECCNGDLEENWRNDNPVDFHKFRSILSKQMLAYCPKRLKYPGDQNMRSVTAIPRQRRRINIPNVTAEQVQRNKRYRASRLCGDIDKLCSHVKKIEKLRKPRVCAWCGSNTYSVCTLCKDDNGKPVPLHYNAKKGECVGAMCFYNYHNDNMFGLGKNDYTRLLGGVKGNWRKPNRTEISQNKEHIESLLEEL